jgi:hypothetical protein
MPPSYDEVIRLPNQYPKLTSTYASTENLPPPTLEEIERGSHSITTITSQTPAIITQPNHRIVHERTQSAVI